MASRVVDVPSSLLSPAVDTKLPLFQRRFGVRYNFDLRQRTVTFSSEEQSRVDEACDELRNAFRKMELSRRTSRSNSRVRCHYFYTVSEASDHAWQFVRTPQPVSDVNTKRFPYELVQHHRERSSALPVQDAGISENLSSKFLLNFSDNCVEFVTEFLKAQMPDLNENSVGVKAVFGKKLFRTFGGLRAQTAYSPQALQAAHREHKLQSSWSNVCNTENQHTHALIADLRAAAQRLEVNEPSERVVVYLKHSGSPEFVVAKFAREYTRIWTLACCDVKVGNRFVLDAMLNNGVSFRVRVFSKAGPEDGVLEQVTRVLKVDEPKDACNVFATRVSLGKANSSGADDEDAASGDWEIEWVSIRTELEVPFKGLVFKLIGLKDELQLEVELPNSDEDDEAVTGVGERFEKLMTKLQEVLGNY